MESNRTRAGLCNGASLDFHNGFGRFSGKFLLHNPDKSGYSDKTWRFSC